MISLWKRCVPGQWPCCILPDIFLMFFIGGSGCILGDGNGDACYRILWKSLPEGWTRVQLTKCNFMAFKCFFFLFCFLITANLNVLQFLRCVVTLHFYVTLYTYVIALRYCVAFLRYVTPDPPTDPPTHPAPTRG